jgi:hypothetical protein
MHAASHPPSASPRHRQRSRTRMVGVPALLLSVGVWGCDDGGSGAGEGSSWTVADSAGVTVVTYGAGTLSAPEDARTPAPFAPDLQAGPSLSIGTVSGEAAYQFTNPVGAVRLSHGGFAVVDRQSRELRYFDAEGAHLATVGGRGDGPGEFQTPSGLRRLEGDSLFLFDTGQQRAHWLAPGGGTVRDASTAVLGLEQRATELVPLGDDGFLAMGGGAIGGGGRPPTSGRIRPEVSVHHAAPDGTSREVARFPGAETDLEVTAASGEIMSVSIMTPPFAARLITAPGTAGFWTSDGVVPEVVLRDAEGPMARLLRFSDPPRPFDAGQRQAVETAALEAAPDEATRERWREGFSTRTYPEILPPISDLFTDAEGRLWIAPTEVPIQNLPAGMGRAAQWWFVVEPEGEPVGWVELPPRTRPLWASDAGVLTVRLDALDVPFVEWWPA